MTTEVLVFIEDRTVALDIEPHLKGLKKEFDDWCNDDEAMAARRLLYAPVFSMLNLNLNMKTEIKRNYAFHEGDQIFVTWSPLKLESNVFQSNTVVASSATDPTEKTVATNSNDSQTLGDAHLTGIRAEEEKSAPTKRNNQETLSESDDSMEDDSYGEVREYFRDEDWARMPKYSKKREKSRFELHEQKLKIGLVKGPFQPELSSEGSSPVKMRKAKNPRRWQKSKSTPAEDKNKENTEPRPSTSKEGNNAQPGPSSAGSGGIFIYEQLQKMKPKLPYYNIPEILEEKAKDADSRLQTCLGTLKTEGFVVGKDRQLLIRLLTRHLFFNIAREPKEATVDMREGLAKSIVMAYPKFQCQADGVNTYPWKHLFERGMGRGWIANSARSIQGKHRTRNSKKKSSVTVPGASQSSDEDSDTMIESLALLMPGRSEKGEILDGMEKSFSHREKARDKQETVRDMLTKYPHLTSYDGEILQEEFRRMQPLAEDLSRNLQRRLPAILGLPIKDRLSPPCEDDAVKALLIMAQHLPRDVRAKTDPKNKSPVANIRDIVEVVQLGCDIYQFVLDKIELATGPIQPYLILVKSPIKQHICKYFLVLDDKSMQLTCGSTVKAVDLLFKAFYVFNVKYPLGWRSTFHCLATCFTNVFEDRGKCRPDSRTPSEHEFMTKINMMTASTSSSS